MILDVSSKALPFALQVDSEERYILFSGASPCVNTTGGRKRSSGTTPPRSTLAAQVEWGCHTSSSRARSVTMLAATVLCMRTQRTSVSVAR